jgi:predicted ATP-grasp superfamily ATP-dependent carboligase
MPICTVIAQAETADQAKKLANERANTIRREF